MTNMSQTSLARSERGATESRSVSDFGCSGKNVGGEPARVGLVSDFIVSEQLLLVTGRY